MASPETQPRAAAPETRTATAAEDAPTAPRGFYSPWFHCYKSLGFYSCLLTAVQRYARTVDRAGRHFRQLVWRELYQFSGRAPASDVAFDISTAGAHGLLEPFVAGLLRLPTVNLVALELVYQSFHQAQRRYPDVFANMFSPVSEGGAAEDTPADPDETTAEGSCVHQQEQQEQGRDQKLGQQHTEGATGEQQQQKPQRRRQQVAYDTIWGSTIASALLQLNLLHAWIPTLERLSPFHKKALWDVCRLVPLFAAAYPSAEQETAGEDRKEEGDKEGSTSSSGEKQERETPPFRALITEWVHNPLQHTAHVTVFFGAVAYLSYFKIIKHEFFYPGSRVPVFARRGDDAETAENGRLTGIADGTTGAAASAPATKKRRRCSTQNDCPVQQQPQQQQQGVLTGTGATGEEKENKEEGRLTPDEFRSMLAKVGIAIPAVAEQPEPQDKEQDEIRATTTELVERLSTLMNQTERQPNTGGCSSGGGSEGECGTGGGKTGPDVERTKALLGFLDTVSCQEGHQSNPSAQGEEVISADEPGTAEHFAVLKRELDALKDQHHCTNTAAVDESILDLPSPTQPVTTAVANSLDAVHAQLPSYLGLFTDSAPFR